MVEELQYYFDANALFKYYPDEKGDLKIRRLVSNAPQSILVSSLTVLECLNVVMQYRRKNILRSKRVGKNFKQLKKDASFKTAHRPFQIIPLSDGIFPVARDILFNQARVFQIGSIDALHLAIVKNLPSKPSIVIVTADKSMQKVCERLSIPFYDPETE
jgi:predicted nucleic acid-binding protein